MNNGLEGLIGLTLGELFRKGDELRADEIRKNQNEKAAQEMQEQEKINKLHGEAIKLLPESLKRFALWGDYRHSERLMFNILLQIPQCAPIYIRFRYETPKMTVKIDTNYSITVNDYTYGFVDDWGDTEEGPYYLKEIAAGYAKSIEEAMSYAKEIGDNKDRWAREIENMNGEYKEKREEKEKNQGMMVSTLLECAEDHIGTHNETSVAYSLVAIGRILEKMEKMGGMRYE